MLSSTFSILSILLLVAIAAICIINELIKKEAILLFLFFLFPLLPVHWGYDPIPGILPAFHAHRILTFLIIFSWFYKMNSNEILKKIRQFPLTGYLSFLFLVVFVSALFSKAKIQTIFYLFSFIVEYYLFAIVFFDIFSFSERRRKFLKALVVSALFVAVMGIFEYFSKHNIYSFIAPYRESMKYAVIPHLRSGVFRIQGSFDHPITFGLFLSMSFVVAIWLYATSSKNSSKLILIIFMLLAATDIFLTQSRAAVVCFITILFLFTIISRPILIFGIFSLFLLFIFQILAFPNITPKFLIMVRDSFLPFLSKNADMLSSFQSRIDMFGATYSLIQKNLLTGFGNLNETGYYLDNFYISFLYSFGFVALIIFLLIMLKLCFMSWVVFKNSVNKDNKLLALLIFCILVGVQVAWFAVALQSYFYLLWFFIALICRMYTNLKLTRLGKL
jgi:hypothetical protein